jgi:hypothetical protein
VQFEAPYATPATVTLLPDPEFADSRALEVNLNYQQTLDGTRYTYVKQTDNIRLIYSWDTLGRGKLLELEEFFQAYAGEFIRIIDHNNKIWKAAIAPGELSFETTKLTRSAGGPRTESGTITLEFIACLKG